MHVRVTFNSIVGYTSKFIQGHISSDNSDHSLLGSFHVEVGSAAFAVIPFYHELG